MSQAQTALVLVEEDFSPERKHSAPLFKIETEDSCYSIYEVCKNGGLRITRGYVGPFVNCILVGWDVVAEACEDVPTFDEYRKRPVLVIAA